MTKFYYPHVVNFLEGEGRLECQQINCLKLLWFCISTWLVVTINPLISFFLILEKIASTCSQKLELKSICYQKTFLAIITSFTVFLGFLWLAEKSCPLLLEHITQPLIVSIASSELKNQLLCHVTGLCKVNQEH